MVKCVYASYNFLFTRWFCDPEFMACLRRREKSEGSTDSLAVHPSQRRSIIQIYTDWANHYLERSRFKRYIQDLQTDICDGVLLADVIEAVIGNKVPDIMRKPKASSPMVDNINSCLIFLSGLGVSVEGISASDIRGGNLKVILSLFFNLSRYKQAQKATSAPPVASSTTNIGSGSGGKVSVTPANGNEMLSKLPSPFRQSSNRNTSASIPNATTTISANSSIPAPSTGSLARRGTQHDRNIRNVAGSTLNTGSTNLANKTAGTAISRSGSPHTAGASSFIPQPKGSVVARDRGLADRNHSRPSSTSSTSSVSHLPIKSASGVTLRNSPSSTASASARNANYSNSMLDKFKFFNSKDKTGDRGKGGAVSKRTSSSSGFSSARSERSDSSTSLCSEPKTGSPPDATDISPGFSSSTSPSTNPPSPSGQSPNCVAPLTTGKTPARKLTGVQESKQQSTNKSRLEGKGTDSTTKQDQPKVSKNARVKKVDHTEKHDDTNKQQTSSTSSANSDKNKTSSEANSVKNHPPASTGKVDGDCYTAIQPDNSIRQSKVSNLKQDKVPNHHQVSTPAKPSADIANETGSTTNTSQGEVADYNKDTTSSIDPNMSSGGNSSIPKPTAAIKGTSKVTKDDKRQGQPTSPHSPTLKEEAKSPSQGQNQISNEVQVANHPPAPVKISRDDVYVPVRIAGTATQVDSGGPTEVTSKSSVLPKTERCRDGIQTTVSIAMVSPIMSSSHSKEKRSEVDIGRSGSNPTDSHHLDSAVKARTGGDDSGISYKHGPHGSTTETRSRQLEATIRELEEGDDVVVNIKPMQPIMRASPYGYIRNLGTLSSSRVLPARVQSPLRMHVDMADDNRLGVSKQLLNSLDPPRIYGVAMKRAMSGCGSVLETDYMMDMDSFDLANGYMSDGDILRPGGICRSDDLASGYMSEGGASIYSRRVGSKSREALAMSREGLLRSQNFFQDDRIKSHPQRPAHRLGFDDSSSISSGISDTFAELSTDDNLTGSSLSSDTNVYGSLKRSPRSNAAPKLSLASDGDRGGRKTGSSATEGSGGGGSGSNKGKSAGGGSVKKTDSCMQTESSAFHHVSSSAWKKYLQQHDHHSRSSPHDKGGGGGDGRKKSSKPETSSSSGSKKNPVSSAEKLQSDSHKSNKHGRLTKTSEDGVRHRNEGDNLSDKSFRSTRSTSPRPGKGSGETVPQTSCQVARGGGGSNESKKGQSCRGSAAAAAVATATNLAHVSSTSSSSSSSSSSSKRTPAAVAAATSTANGKTASAKTAVGSKKCSAAAEKASSELAAKAAADGAFKDGGAEMQRPHAQVPATSRATAPSSGGVGQSAVVGGSKGTLERKGKVKVCANTQTTAHDLYLTTPHSDSEYSSLGRKYPPKQYYTTSPTVGLKERVYGSRSMLNGSPTPMSDYVLLSGLHSTSRTTHGPRLSAPLKCSDNDNYVTLDQSCSVSVSSAPSPYSWLRHSPSCGTSVASAPVARSYTGGVLTEAESMESLSSTTSSIHAQGPRYLFPLSPVNPSIPSSSSSNAHTNGRSSSSMSHYMGGMLPKISSKDDEAHGSTLSLVSTTSSLYSTAEEKQVHEIRKLKRELEQAHEKVATLTSQLTTNAHMVAAFEQSLSNMTSRLQHLTASAEQKDSELSELRNTIEALKKQSAEAGLTKMALQSMQAVQRTLQEHRISRQFSTDSMSSVNSFSSACSGTSGKSGDALGNKKKKKKGWLRSSFSKAFSRSKKNKNGSVSDVEDLRQLQSDSSTPNSPLLGATHHLNGVNGNQSMKLSHSSSALYDKDEEQSPEIVQELQKQLRQKDMVLTDIRLEALTSAHQLESLKETVNKMRGEMMSLKNDNDRLQRLVSTKSLTSSQSSLPLRNSLESLDKRLSASEASCPPSVDIYVTDANNDLDGKMVTISVILGCHGDYNSYISHSKIPSDVLIGSVSVSGKTKWDLLDNLVKRTFKEYVLRVDPVSNLGLNAESVISYHIGDITRSKEVELPELLPCGYLVGDNMQIQVVLKGTKQNSVDALAFETLIPKSIVQRYASLLSEHRRIILCGPSGTGKTYVAQKLAEYLVLRNGKELRAGSIATFSVDHKSAKELRQYLSNVAEQCESSNASDLPSVIILDNLHHVGSLGEVFNGFLSAKYQKCPYIIGTMNQATCSTTNLQLHHNFRWVLCANHMEPVKGFLGRYLRRKLIEEEIRNGMCNPELTKVIDWMPKVWQQLNKFLETHSSSDVTIGPRLFLSCPVDVSSSQVWFTDLWNYSIIPYLLEAVREGLQLYGRRAPWEDPADWVHQTYPWPAPSVGEWPQLLRLRPEDVGYEGHPGPGLGNKNVHPAPTDMEADPLLNMLMRLQEAASYSSPHSNDSDSTSLDSHSSGLHTEDLVSSGLESTI